MRDPVDVHVGGRIKLRRQLLGLSQGKLAVALGLTFQQVQKYEKGANRVSASRLLEIASVLNVPILFFFDDMPSEMAGPTATPSDVSELNKDTAAFARTYTTIQDPKLRGSIRNLVRELAGKAH